MAEAAPTVVKNVRMDIPVSIAKQNAQSKNPQEKHDDLNVAVYWLVLQTWQCFKIRFKTAQYTPRNPDKKQNTIHFKN